jgi:hypothetical protein
MLEKITNYLIDRPILATFLSILFILGLTAVAGYALGSWRCSTQWNTSKMEYRYTNFVCLVHSKNEGWIPGDNFRSLD